MNRLTITTGIGEDRNGQAIRSSVYVRALARIREWLAREHGGFTEVDTNGGWINPSGALVMEGGKRFIVLTAEPFAGHRTADFIRRALNQESVVLEVERNVSVAFVDAGGEQEATAG